MVAGYLKDERSSGDAQGRDIVMGLHSRTLQHVCFRIAMEMTEAQFERVIAMLQGGAGGGVAGAAAVVGTMGLCVLGKDKLKRPKKWYDWKKDAENKMRFLKIKEDEP